MRRDEFGLFSLEVENARPGGRYLFQTESGLQFPDPASHHQPLGVFGPSELVGHDSFAWSDADYAPPDFSELVVYESHPGAFTPEGTLEAAGARLDHLKRLGVNAVELTPLAQFSGPRNWGYDGVFPFAVQNSYGGPQGLKRFVDRCHGLGMAVIVDAVFNHLGPEGNHLRGLAPYFTDKNRIPWGEAVNFDGPDSDRVRDFFCECMAHWFENYHVDGLRLDAVHAMLDQSAEHILARLSREAEEIGRATGRQRWLIAESDLNDPRMVGPRNRYGLGQTAQWMDDFHHALHALLTGEKAGYYRDFGRVEDLGQALRQGFVRPGEYRSHRRRSFGSCSVHVPPERFVVYAQNHDMVGNRPGGERLAGLVPFERLRLAAAVTLFSPYIPMLFMGEEYGEDNPFLYFVSHSDMRLNRAVARGRAREHKDFGWPGQSGNCDPCSPEAFLRSRLDWDKLDRDENRGLFGFYREALRLRREMIDPRSRRERAVWTSQEDKTLVLALGKKLLAVYSFNSGPGLVNTGELQEFLSPGPWEKLIDSSARRWSGPGQTLAQSLKPGDEIGLQPWNAALYGLAEQG